MNFTDALKEHKAKNKTVLIPDIKCFSPKDGDLMRGRDPVSVAKALEQAGACALSVVTEEKEFHGSLNLLREICSAVSVPVLRKDFITDEKDLDETVRAGAKAILLMVSCLGQKKLAALYQAALDAGLTPFVETHTYEEYVFAMSLKAPLIGINNRDITVLEKDDGTVDHSGNILKRISSGTEPEAACESAEEHLIHRAGGKAPVSPFIIVESALRDREDVRRALRNGADGVLVGTAILRGADPVKRFRALTSKTGIKICGLMTEADVDVCLAQDVDICGFVVQYPVDVRWNIDAQTAEKLIRRVKEKAGPHIRVCIVTGGEPEKVIKLAENLKPDLVQLHYRETFDQTDRIARQLLKSGTEVIRSIPGEQKALEEMFGTAKFDQVLELLAGSEAAGILLDSRSAANAASGGGSILETFDPDISESLRKFSRSGKMILAGGGITADNASQVMTALDPDYLDIMTGAEDVNGRKSAEIIGALAEVCRR